MERSYRVLAPRSVILHEKLIIGTKELQSLQIGDHVMIQIQLGNKPKQWDKRGVVIHVQPHLVLPLVPVDDVPSPCLLLYNKTHCRHHFTVNQGCCTRVGPRQERYSQPTQAPTPPPAPVTVYQTQPAMYQPPPVPAPVYQQPPDPQASTTT